MAAALALVLALQAIPAAAAAAPEAANPLSSLRLEVGSSDDGNEQALEIELRPEGVTGPRVVVKKTLPPAPRSEVIRIDDLRPGPYRLVLSGPALAREERRVEVPARGLAALDLIRLAPGVSLDGRITDSSGSPVPRASVHLSGSEGFVSGATDAEGSFRLQGLKRGATYHYFIRDQVHFQVEGQWNGEARLERTLTEATLVSGRVVDANGAPVAEVKLGFAHVSKAGSGAGGSPHKTDADGRFSARVPSADTNRLLLDASGFLQLEREISLEKGGTVPREIDLGVLRLERGRRVHGRVVDGATGLPIRSARLTCDEARDPTRAVRLRLDPERVTSGEDGTFELRAVPRDIDVTLLVDKEGFSRRLLPLPRDEEGPLEIAMTPGGRIEAVLCGSPAEIARSALDVEIPGVPSPRLQRPPDTAGRFVFENVTPGRILVVRSWRSGDGHMTSGSDARAEVTVVEGGTSRARVACGPVPVGGIAFVDGKPAAGLILSVTTGRMGRGVSALTDADGRFQARVDAPGTYSASGASIPLHSREACVVPEGGRSDCVFELRPPAPR